MAGLRRPIRDQLNPRQVLTVTAHSASAWDHDGDRWVRALGPYPAEVGAQGIGVAREGLSLTPAGIWPLTEAFGIEPNPGTRLPYRQVTTSDWWVSDVHSPLYNTHYRGTPGQFDEAAGENLGAAGPAYAHAVVIDYNRSPVVPGAGSAFFLHVTTGGPTAGCVALAQNDLIAVLRWLDPARKPVIAITDQPSAC
ncbi:L,D-transpeptidase [Amycolatopsis halotolerans]|uniref:L,D-transpeptidase n=1 Tax=Amycolatopsis halotolerans TaxID=330083 RepID=A0ABV7QRG7_9PSEU